jgi:hypothetical protein
MPNEGDLLYAGQRQRARILERTAHGVDVDNVPFVPYSTRGPYYYKPHGRLGASVPLDVERRSAKRMLRTIAPAMTDRQREEAGVRLSRTGRSIVFRDGYAGFKRWLGRTTVDLRGPRAPHMLQGITVKVPAERSILLGIYGPAADRATGHNIGAGHLPRRRFFSASHADLKAMLEDMRVRMRARTVKGG